MEKIIGPKIILNDYSQNPNPKFANFCVYMLSDQILKSFYACSLNSKLNRDRKLSNFLINLADIEHNQPFFKTPGRTGWSMPPKQHASQLNESFQFHLLENYWKLMENYCICFPEPNSVSSTGWRFNYMKAITVSACILQNKNMLCSTPAVYKIIYNPRDPKSCMILHT